MSKSLHIATVWLLLMALLAATLASSLVLRGPVGLAAGLAIASAKSALVFWFFMHLKDQNGLKRIAATAALFWLLFLFVLSGLDFFSR